MRVRDISDLPPGLRARLGPGLDDIKTDDTPAKPKAPRPRRDEEHQHQVALFRRIRTLALRDARYAGAADRTYAIPNGGGRSKREAGRLKAEGVRSGVSDLFVSFPAGGFHGLYIEMKSRTGRPSREQRAWIAQSLELGYAAACCQGVDEAMRVWTAYVDGRWDEV